MKPRQRFYVHYENLYIFLTTMPWWVFVKYIRSSKVIVHHLSKWLHPVVKNSFKRTFTVLGYLSSNSSSSVDKHPFITCFSGCVQSLCIANYQNKSQACTRGIGSKFIRNVYAEIKYFRYIVCCSRFYCHKNWFDLKRLKIIQRHTRKEYISWIEYKKLCIYESREEFKKYL